ncbi:MAG: response regulator [Candidatus Eisenbacteria bacterium]
MFRRSHEITIQARAPVARERIVVVSEDSAFWLGLRREAPDLEGILVLAHSAREALILVEDRRVRGVILDATLRDKPATQLLGLIRSLRAELPIVFAFDSSDVDVERQARAAGVLYYGHRSELSEIVRVMRQSLKRPVRSRLRPSGMLLDDRHDEGDRRARG